jgi:hypothetical protein
VAVQWSFRLASLPDERIDQYQSMGWTPGPKVMHSYSSCESRGRLDFYEKSLLEN